MPKRPNIALVSDVINLNALSLFPDKFPAFYIGFSFVQPISAFQSSSLSLLEAVALVSCHTISLKYL